MLTQENKTSECIDIRKRLAGPGCDGSLILASYYCTYITQKQAEEWRRSNWRILATSSPAMLRLGFALKPKEGRTGSFCNTVAWSMAIVFLVYILEASRQVSIEKWQYCTLMLQTCHFAAWPCPWNWIKSLRSKVGQQKDIADIAGTRPHSASIHSSWKVYFWYSIHGPLPLQLKLWEMSLLWFVEHVRMCVPHEHAGEQEP